MRTVSFVRIAELLMDLGLGFAIERQFIPIRKRGLRLFDRAYFAPVSLLLLEMPPLD